MGHIAEAMKKARIQREERQTASESSENALALLVGAPEARSGHGAPSRFAPRLNEPGCELHRPTADAVSPSAGSWDVNPTLVAQVDKASPITEQYRAVRTWLLCRTRPNERTCLAVTSSMPQEGKTVTAANIAVVMSEIRRMRVLAVDCDLRRGDMAGLFGLSRAPGLADVLSGRARLDEVILPTPLPNLSVLPAGELGEANPTELLSSVAAARVFDEIRERFHYSVVDTPPVHRVSDVGVIGTLCTGVVMVVRMHKTPTSIVRQSVQWLQSNNLNVMGTIATGCSPKDAISNDRPSDEDR